MRRRSLLDGMLPSFPPAPHSTGAICAGMWYRLYGIVRSSPAAHLRDTTILPPYYGGFNLHTVVLMLGLPCRAAQVSMGGDAPASWSGNARMRSIQRRLGG